MSESQLAAQSRAERPLSQIKSPNGERRRSRSASIHDKLTYDGLHEQSHHDNGHEAPIRVNGYKMPHAEPKEPTSSSTSPQRFSNHQDGHAVPNARNANGISSATGAPLKPLRLSDIDTPITKRDIIEDEAVFTRTDSTVQQDSVRSVNPTSRTLLDDADADQLRNRGFLIRRLKPETETELSIPRSTDEGIWQVVTKKGPSRKRADSATDSSNVSVDANLRGSRASTLATPFPLEQPPLSSRTVSSPMLKRKQSSSRMTEKSTPLSAALQLPPRPAPSPLEMKDIRSEKGQSKLHELQASPIPLSLPLPPVSLSTYLQLELSSSEPSSRYIYRSRSSSLPYESSKIKLERLLNFLSLPPHLEQVLWFGTIACLDAWLYTFTILPLRFIRALYALLTSTTRNLWLELTSVLGFIYSGLGRVWKRRQTSIETPSSEAKASPQAEKESSSKPRRSKSASDSRPLKSRGSTNINGSAPESGSRWSNLRHRRLTSVPSTLLPSDKADLLKGFLIIASCIILMYFDASMMYHTIRGQAAIKLYVIYNVLEVFDRLLSAIGQDVLECLFSKEVLERRPDGRSKILRPLWLFCLALVYNVVHAIALFYQVITLNVAVNSYSNALLTLLMSNQFVEIKGTVFKRFEKENLFQMTCADVVERFQLWLMLTIIASRNLIETNSLFAPSDSPSPSNASLRSLMLPSSFTILPSWAGQVLGPFLLVLGTETLVDWLKHAYITKFNNTAPRVYGRFLDVLAKDYYAHAFADQDLVKRLGLPVLPLACLFIRASVQTYHMFLATHLPLPLATSATSGSGAAAVESPATTAAMLTLDQLVRRALGRHVPASAAAPPSLGAGVPLLQHLPLPSADALIAATTTLVFFCLLFLLLLSAKLLLGMALLAFARRRYRGMKAREHDSGHAEGKRAGGWGGVEVDDDKRRWIYDDDRDALRKLREKERDRADKERQPGARDRFEKVERYSMVGKRIW